MYECERTHCDIDLFTYLLTFFPRWYWFVCFVQLTDLAYAVTTSVLSNFVELCLFNIAQTDTQTVTEAIQSFNGSVQITSIVSVEINILINYLISIVCPGDPTCSGRGQCVNGFCVCDSGRQCMQCMHIPYWLTTMWHHYVQLNLMILCLILTILAEMLHSKRESKGLCCMNSAN